MGNPNNTSILVGRVTNEPKFIKNRHGQEFSCRFVLAVSRNYKCSDGSTRADFLPVHLDGIQRLEHAHRIQKGDRLVLTGAIKSDNYTDAGGNQVYTMYVEADSFSWTFGRGSGWEAHGKQKAAEAEPDDVLELEISALPFA